MIELLESSESIVPFFAYLNHEASAKLYWPAGGRTEIRWRPMHQAASMRGLKQPDAWLTNQKVRT